MMHLSEAIAIVIDAARQQAALNRASGRCEGVAAMQDQACERVEQHARGLADEA